MLCLRAYRAIIQPIHILTHSTLRNPAILKVRQLPGKFFGRFAVWPRGPLGFGVFMRLIIEFQAVRYVLTLCPFIFIRLSWNALARPMAQAPILMIFMIWFVEMRILRVPKARRPKLIEHAQAERMLDLLRAQSRATLTKIAAAPGMKRGELHLVVEQSELWRFPPLTYVSVQSEDGPEVVQLTTAEQEILKKPLFQPPLTEKVLQRANQSQGVFLHEASIAMAMRGTSVRGRNPASNPGSGVPARSACAVPAIQRRAGRCGLSWGACITAWVSSGGGSAPMGHAALPHRQGGDQCVRCHARHCALRPSHG